MLKNDYEILNHIKFTKILNLLDFKHTPLFVLNLFDENNKIELTSENVDHYQDMIDKTMDIIQSFLTIKLNEIHHQLRTQYGKLYRHTSIQTFMDENLI